MKKQWQQYTAKEIRPAGWMKKQLEIQAKGLSGNLDKVWRDVRDSAWIGGPAEGWERVPYWLDGFVPLAYLLEDEDMIARAKKYIDAILAAQKEDGWICPCADEDRPTYDSWAVQLISKTLLVYYECSGDERIPDVLYRILKNYYDLLKAGTVKLFGWGEYRWFETFLALRFLYERGAEPWMTELAQILREQGVDYDQFVHLWKRPLNKVHMATHIVGIGMMLKREAVTHELLGEEYTDRSEYYYQMLKNYNGMPVETFTGDEHLGGLSPIRGTELCAVVEMMYSYELMFAYTFDRKWLERLEVAAFNALPATISDDMWAHQYDQMSNQIACIRFPRKPVFGTNGSEAHLFGLEPNYGCCTANFSQGWPKFLISSFMHKEGTILHAVPIPAVLKAAEADVTVETAYPFDNAWVYTVDAKSDFTLQVRIPGFARKLTVDGVPADGSTLSFALRAGEHRVIRFSYETEAHFVDRPHTLKTVQCGSLVFSLPIAYDKVMYEYTTPNGVERKFPFCDYEYVGKTPWNYGFSDVALTVERRGVGEMPFSSENPPVVVKAQMQPVAWGLEPGYENVCAAVPASRAPIGEPEMKELYPYGCAKLRMTEMPMTE